MIDWCRDCQSAVGLGQCPGCMAVASMEMTVEDLPGDELNEPICSHCGKPFYEFSELGCGYCDRRHPEFGLMD